MANFQPMKLTFGLEVEFILAAKDSPTSSLKNTSIRIGSNLPSRPRPRRGSGLALDSEDLYGISEEEQDELEDGGWGEISEQERRHLARLSGSLCQAGCPTDFRDHSKIYDCWFLVPDGTVQIVDDDEEIREEVSNRLGQRAEDVNICEWAVSGSELVSPILSLCPHPNSAAEPSLKEASRYVAALRDTISPSILTWINSSAGLHVHVSFDLSNQHVTHYHIHARPSSSQSNPHITNSPTYAGVPLPVLQHLSYLLVQFESHISSLHPQYRRGLEYLSYIACATNLIGVQKSEHICPRRPLRPIQDIQNTIFASDMTTRKLVNLMGRSTTKVLHTFPGRDRFVNFANLDPHLNPTGKQTLEFRQHAGTLDPDEVVKWTIFVTSLVRTAERLANTPPSDSKKSLDRQAYEEIGKYPVPLRDGYATSIEPLFALMRLSPPDIAYWRARAVKYAEEDEEYPIDWEQSCKGCLAEKCEREGMVVRRFLDGGRLRRRLVPLESLCPGIFEGGGGGRSSSRRRRGEGRVRGKGEGGKLQ